MSKGLFYLANFLFEKKGHKVKLANLYKSAHKLPCCYVSDVPIYPKLQRQQQRQRQRQCHHALPMS